MKNKIYLTVNTLLFILLFIAYNYISIEFGSFYASISSLIIFGIMLSIFFLSDTGKSYLKFIKLSFAEIKLIHWQKSTETLPLMVKIFIICLISGISIFILDNIISEFIKKILF